MVTCRTNFNPFHSNKIDAENQVDKFNELFLQEINETDIERYLRNECSRPDTFRKALLNSKIADLFKNPFYLVNAISIFNSKTIIPDSKTLFFKELIKQRIDKEKKKDNSFLRNLDEFELAQGLRILALTMQYSGDYKIEKIDFERTIRSKRIRDNIKRIFFIEVEDYWQFEHNNFQEFLAAEAISEFNWDKIKKIVLLPNNRLKPKWLNVFSFLINLSNTHDKFISHFVKEDIESLVKVEPDKIDKKLRDQVYIQIFNKHKLDGTIIWRNSYTTRDLYFFGELERNEYLLVFLINEIRNTSSSIQAISNAVHLIYELQHPKSFINEIKTQYIELLKVTSNHKYGISRIILKSFVKWNQLDSELKDILISIDNLFTKDAPLSAICYYLVDGKFTDLTAELVYKLILLLKESRVIGEQYALFDLIKKLSYEELNKLIYKLVPIGYKKTLANLG